MTTSFSLYLEELKHLNLLQGTYAIFGSGPIAIRGLRDSNDVDVIVKDEVYKKLCDTYPNQAKTSPFSFIQIGNIEIGNQWLNSSEHINEMIDTAEIIDGFPFVQLHYVLVWKKQMGREKDLKDIALIEEYINSQK